MRALGPRSRIRRDGLKRVLRFGWAAAPRKDWELRFVRYSPDVIWEIPEEFQRSASPGAIAATSGVEWEQEFSQPSPSSGVS